MGLVATLRVGLRIGETESALFRPEVSAAPPSKDPRRLWLRPVDDVERLPVRLAKKLVDY